MNRKVIINHLDIKVEKLNLEEQSDLKLLKNKSARLNPYSLFAAENSEWLVLFYASLFLKIILCIYLNMTRLWLQILRGIPFVLKQVLVSVTLPYSKVRRDVP
ncbi:hypothetical protein AOU00_02055 [Paenibacillus polymyxa]|nr:hypothetical protein AOU00_02055 [Paenibacillus polymyxa]